MFPLWFKIPGHYLTPNKKVFRKRSKSILAKKETQSRYYSDENEEHKALLRKEIDRRFTVLEKKSYIDGVIALPLFLVSLVVLVFFGSQYLSDWKNYYQTLEEQSELTAMRRNNDQRQEAYHVMMSSGKANLQTVDGSYRKDQTLFAKEEFERVLKLFPNDLEANVGLSISLARLCMSYGGDCVAAKKMIIFTSNIEGVKTEEFERIKRLLLV